MSEYSYKVSSKWRRFFCAEEAKRYGWKGTSLTLKVQASTRKYK